jgi:hypothetical protein
MRYHRQAQCIHACEVLNAPHVDAQQGRHSSQLGQAWVGDGDASQS